MYFENKLEEETFAKALALLNQLYGGAQAQEEHFENKRKNLIVLNGNKSIEIKKSVNPNKKGDTLKMILSKITITKRKDNRYYARITLNKKQISIYGKTKQECYEKVKYTLQNKDTIKTKPPLNQIKILDWIYRWRDTYKKPKLKPLSLFQIDNCIKNHIKPHIENKPLNQIKPIDINTALNKIKTSRMKKYAYDCYRDALREAYKNQITKLNLADLIDRVTHVRQKGRSLTREERKIFLKKVKLLKYGKIFEFMFYSGCRPQGARTLKWENIGKETIFIDETKSKNGTRHIPLFTKLKELLDNIEHTNEYVFPISETTIKKEFLKLKELCGFNFTQKDLRHTFATICAENNINDNILAKWMGHGNPSTTKQYYIEVLNDFEKAQRDKLNKDFDALM